MPLAPEPHLTNTAKVFFFVVTGISLLLVAVIAVSVWVPNSSSETSTETFAPANPNHGLPEFQLASSDAGSMISDPENTTVIRFRYLLDNIASATGETRQHIADVTIDGQQTLHNKYGKDVKLLDLMEAAWGIVQQYDVSSTSKIHQSYEQIVYPLVVAYGSQ